MYIEQAYKGLSDSWRYVVGLLAVFFVWQFIGGIPLIIALLVEADSLEVLGSGDMGAMAEVLGSNSFLYVIDLCNWVDRSICLCDLGA